MMSEDRYESLLAIFVTEAQEHLQTINRYLLDWHESAGWRRDEPALVDLFRAAHTLKGAAAAADIKEIQLLSYQLEAIFGKLRSGELEREAEIFDLVSQTVETIALVVRSLQSQEEAGVNIDELYRRLITLTGTSLPLRSRGRYSFGRPANTD
jgi:two-component system, chemotaxis family, sensor kinase CheA